MSFLFVLNAAFLCFLGVYLYRSQRNRHSFILLFFNLGLALWFLCAFLVQHSEGFHLALVDILAKLQLVASLVLVNGIFYFCASYPYPRHHRYFLLNAIPLSLLVVGLLGTDLITSVTRVDGRIVYQDHAVGFALYALYMSVLGIATLYYLYDSFRRYPDHRSEIRYLLGGLALFALFAIGCNIILPLFGVYDLLTLGRLSGIFPALSFAYVIAKMDFLDAYLIINRKTAWGVTLGIIVLSVALLHSLLPFDDAWQLAGAAALALFWAVCANPLQNFLLTSAKRKFIRSWYDTDNVILELSNRITDEKNREAIFNILENVLDEVFQLEQSQIVVAIRHEDQRLSHYISIRKEGRLSTDKKKLNGSELVKVYSETAGKPSLLEDCEESVRHELLRQGYERGRQCVVLPFYSPEFLEGVLVLGKRSSEESYSERDMRFFQQLVNYMAAILYRLTPFEQLEKLYFDNKQRLHEAEIQLIRAQKIQSIVHATRQCHHEIRTPLNIIRLGIGRIRSLADLEAYKVVAKEEISRALEIVEETLTITDVTKASEDRYSMISVNEVLARCARLVDQTRYKLVMDLEETGPLWGSFSDIQVAVTNLIHNAVDAMPEGGLMSLSTRKRGDNIVIEVEDSGSGIPESLRSRVWEPYFSGHETEVGNSNAGRGWGLTIVNRIVTDHRGTINFTSEPGVGTRFTISLPAGEAGRLSRESMDKDKEGMAKVIPFDKRVNG